MIELTTTCPHCGTVATLVSDIPADGLKPWPGAANLCWECMRASVYDDQLQLRMPTLAELDVIETDPQVRKIRELRHEL